MPVQDFEGKTFVAFLDISGFKELMKEEVKAIKALDLFFKTGYDSLRNNNGVEGFLVSDCGILFVRNGIDTTDKLKKLLLVVKNINKKMLEEDYMLTTSIAFGDFKYRGKIEFDGIEKNQIYGHAYVKAFLDNEKGKPKIQLGQCRLVSESMPDIDLNHADFKLLKKRNGDTKHHYYYWNVELPEQIEELPEQIEEFERQYRDSYTLKYAGMLKALKRQNE